MYETITAGAIPPTDINGGLAAIGLLVWMLVSKFLNHLPLYWLEQIAARKNVTISRSIMTESLGCLGLEVRPLADRLNWHLLQQPCLLADETPVPQLDPGKGKTKKDYLWVYSSNDLQPEP